MYVPFRIPPGIVKKDADNTSMGRWVDMDKMRFFGGFPEKIGGWVKTVSDAFTGICRGAHGWTRNDQTNQILVGTAAQLFHIGGGTITDITPWGIGDSAIALTDPFTTTSGSAEVTVTDTDHGITQVGLTVSFSGASAVGGITIDGDYTVTSITDVNNFVITHTSNATSNATGGGSVTASYLLQEGNVSTVLLAGYGIGGWGEDGWGEDAAFEAIADELRIWCISQYGEDAICSPTDNGGIYYYDVSNGAQKPTQITNAPTQNRFTFVTPERYIFALGTNDISSGTQENMTVRWPDVDDYTDWTITSTNTANQRKLQGGSKLMAGCPLGRGLSLVWSDTSLFEFQFTGSDFVYSSRLVGQHCGLISAMAFANNMGVAFWMSKTQFHMYNGYVQDIPNQADIRDFVFDNINDDHKDKCFAWYNSRQNEVWFHYPSGSNTECDRYVFYDLDNQRWSVGTMDRSYQSQITTNNRFPALYDHVNSYIYTHELDYNKDADGSAMEAFIELAPFEVSQGNVSVDVMGIVPDMERQVGDVSLYLETFDHPRGTALENETLTIEPTDELVDARVCGRQISMKWTSNVASGDFRLGEFGVEITVEGEQR